MPTAAQLRDTLRELVCDELKARGPAMRCCGPQASPPSHL